MRPILERWRLVVCPFLMVALVGAARAADQPAAPSADWPQWGGSPARNNAVRARGLLAEWNVGQFDKKTGQWLGGPEAKGIRWVARLGSESYGTPVVAGDKVYCATNNGAGYLARYPASVDLGCLLCFRRGDGKFLWQHAVEKLGDSNLDWPKQGICSTPLVEGDRLWIVTNRGEICCLDTEGFADGENDGPYQSEKATGPGESDVVWSFDMPRALGVVPRYMTSCSVTAAGALILSGTSNGVDIKDQIPAPDAPSFLALDKKTGKLVWADNSPGRNLLDGQWSSPAFGVLGGVPQAIFAGGDGWVYSFEVGPTDDRKPRLLWKFDCNPKDARWEGGGRGRRNHIVATPVIFEGRVYVATGQDPEAGEGEADLWCIDPTQRGDVSPEIVVDSSGKPVPPQRTIAADKTAGHHIKPNPNSAAVWGYRGKGGGAAHSEKQFESVMHRSLGMPAIQDGILVIGDFSGLVHCLDARTGKVHWTHDLLSAVWGSPLIADGKVYLGTEDGDVVVLAHGPELKTLAKNAMGNSVYGSPVAAGGVLYVNTRSHLFAIGP